MSSSLEPDRPTAAVRLHVVPELDAVDEQALEEHAARVTSGALWRVLCAGTTYARLTAALKAEYDGRLEHAAADIDAFLAARRERGLEAS
jgi:hypothetical protein